MRRSVMALFPAFAEVEPKRAESSSKGELDWLNNKTFQTGDAISLHNCFLETTKNVRTEKEQSLDSQLSSPHEEQERLLPKKKKKKSEKKRKNKKHKKKSGKYSDSSGSESETIYPSDLKREEENGSQAAPLASSFSWLDDVQLPTAQLFCVDRKPDPANWTYKSLYRGDIAKYRRKGNSSLGLDPRKQEVSWEESQSKKKKKGTNKKAADRYYSAVNRQMLKSEALVSIFPTNSECSGATGPALFLPLTDDQENTKGPPGGDVQSTAVNPLGVYDSSTTLWLQGKGQQVHAEQEKSEPSATPLTGRTEEFNRQLREQPTDTQLWIKFIKFQDELSTTVFGNEEGEQGITSVDRRKSSYRAVLEKKLSIAERAIATNPCSITLQLERLKICQELLEPSVLAKEWKKLVFLHPNSAPLWREYLLFTQSYFSSFAVSKVNAAYGKCLSTLSAVRDGSMVSHPALPGVEEDMLDIFIQQCHFLRQAGHSEKAISLFQAMMDFTFFKPDSVQKLTTKQQVEFFEPFWDSGEARVGEIGARGWKMWMLQQERGGWIQPSEEEEEEEEEDEEEVKDRSQPRHTIWLDVESSREAAHWLPWRPDKAKGQSEEDCEDPDRQVLFDDIGPSLILLPSPELQLRLLVQFLAFLGLPTDFALSAAPRSPDILLENLSLLTHGVDPQRPLTYQDLPDTGVNPVGLMTTLQGNRKWVGLGKQGEKFVANLLKMVQPVLRVDSQTNLALSRMRYEKLKVLRCLCSGNKKRLRSQGKSSKRIAKQLLKESDNRSSLVLWREYGHLEWLIGNLEEARKVFSTAMALGGNKGLRNPALCDLCLLWAQLEVEEVARAPGAGLTDVTASPALHVLTQLAEAASPASQTLSPVSILKARKLYDQALTARLSALDQTRKKGQEDPPGENIRLRGLAGSYALFQYLTVGIQAANAVYSQARERMEALHHSLISNMQNVSEKDDSLARAADASHSEADSSHTQDSVSRLASDCEALAVQQAALLRYHKSVSVFPLATVREMLTSALSTWPTSAPLWSIYVQVENRYHSAGRARRFFHSITRSNSCMVPRLFAIVAEQQRKQLIDAALGSCGPCVALPTLPENGLSNRIRGLFENIVSKEAGSRCPLVWRMYMHFLVSDGKIEKALGIFYKALQNVPWAKGVYMDGVQLFPGRIQEFVDVMTEKELRLRLPIEELDILLEE
ncbi:nuclear exosome regulator NRDE2 isoform X1 [Takifugu flavidus]|uniref:Protein NRDE2-like protein n=1 Tax=Takifugu flavidus TaxID=433684 RepID=A0A5C6P0B8_9TELE|nr:nuclear exosome regulator NRDE2 isoform X1 [Takifugu flavidus]TWW72359.1 Protein NRDE2 -like protein [Takifugu flavidus]